MVGTVTFTTRYFLSWREVLLLSLIKVKDLFFISISVGCSYCDIMYRLLVVYLRERSHVPETAAWPGPGADPESYAETSRGPGPNLLEDPLLLYLVEQGEHRITFSTPFGAVLQLSRLMYLSYPLCRRWRCLPHIWRRSWGCWAPSCSWRDDGSFSSGSWGLLLSAPGLDTWDVKDEEMEYGGKGG